jgi:hypothetical protein
MQWYRKMFRTKASMASAIAFFSIVVVAEEPLYTTTTSGLRGTMLFVFCVRDGLKAGCASCHKQYR